ncbi:MAG: thiolase family protein [Verrucomicrobiota bacterium]
MMKSIVLCGACRTPIGSFSGSLSTVAASELGALVARNALERAGASPSDVDEVIFGNVLSAGQGQNMARQVAMKAGFGVNVGGTTINKVCGSGLKSVMLAAQAIRCGDADLIVAGGAENMSMAPYLLDKARSGYRLGHGQLVDSVIRDGLWDVYHDKHMGMCGDQCAEKYAFTREDQDNYAVRSFQRARKAAEEGVFKNEIVPVEVKSRKGSVMVEVDEGPAVFNEEKLRSLRAAFGKDGTVTAGNASSINDGAAAVVVCSEEVAHAVGLKIQARILGYATASIEPEWFTLAPIHAVRKLLDMTGKSVSEVDVFEVNEAFAVVAMAAIKDLELPEDKVNILGGAVSLGHPIGASGARTLVTLLNALNQTNGAIGVDTLCIGGGEAVAMMVERVVS